MYMLGSWMMLVKSGGLENTWLTVIPGLLRQCCLVYYESAASKNSDLPMD